MMKRGTKGRNGQRLFDALVRLVRKDKAAFTARLIRNTEAQMNGCVVWTGATSGGKYGGVYPRINFRIGSKTLAERAHRVFLTLKLGRPIKHGMEAGHTCGNPLCVRHVEEQTVQQNLNARYHGKEDGQRDTGTAPF